jgi:hypothetical protein
MLALVSLFWFGEGVWVAIKGSLGEAYFPAFMGLLFAVAVYINYRTYMTRVAPFNRRQSSGTDNSLHGLPTFGTYQPGGPPRSSGNRWMNWARYSFRLRLLGIFVFGGMILLYNTGGHYLGAWTKTNGTQVAPEVQLPPVTRTPAGDVSVQSDLISAAATARAVYVANHGTFDGLSSAAMNSQPGNHLLFTIVQSPRGSQKAISFSGTGEVMSLAEWGNDNDDICWFASVNMQVNGGAPPGGIQFVGVKSPICAAGAGYDPSAGWAVEFPPMN